MPIVNARLDTIWGLIYYPGSDIPRFSHIQGDVALDQIDVIRRAAQCFESYPHYECRFFRNTLARASGHTHFRITGRHNGFGNPETGPRRNRGGRNIALKEDG
ncbi:MAG TPA: hypothetical protein ENH63_17760 [Sulfitobacter litoralis]|uniref:Uncharacterized protein n=1 Tax=Sulfitobacter litoralis TaxID=335975 RepID=A0A7V1BHY8_9RHOB|nr:hypothetical protein [Sulfitobacter litoralis]HDZ53579.1 hypothetical protein [Sulfitobacter litoralis]